MKLTYIPLTHSSSGISTWMLCKLKDTKLGASKRSLWSDCIQTRKCYSLGHVQTLWDPMDCSPPGSSVHGIPRQEHWSGLRSLLQGIFPTQGSNPGLLYCRQILYQLRNQGSPHTPEHVIKSSVLMDTVWTQ